MEEHPESTIPIARRTRINRRTPSMILGASGRRERHVLVDRSSARPREHRTMRYRGYLGNVQRRD
jgi:hypothetical protein